MLQDDRYIFYYRFQLAAMTVAYSSSLEVHACIHASYIRAQRLRTSVTINSQAGSSVIGPCTLIAFSVNLFYDPLCGRINVYSVRTNPRVGHAGR